MGTLYFMKKKIKNVAIILSILLVVLSIGYPGILYINFINAERSTDVNKIDANPKRFTIIYRRGCSRCKKTIPKFILEHGFSNKKYQVINANKLDPEQLEKYDVDTTPTFRLNGESYNTTNMKIIEKLWKDAK